MPGFNPATNHFSSNVPTGTTSASRPPEAYKYIVLQDQKGFLVQGGNGFGGFPGIGTRTLNTVLLDQTGAVNLSSNQFTLHPGTYRVWALAPAFQVGGTYIALRNVTDSTTTIQGDSVFSSPDDGDQVFPQLSGQFTITSTKVFDIRQLAGGTTPNTRLGWTFGQGDVAVYTTVFITKVD